ncbi:MAG: DUF4114 domain-containing protein [Opitutaceae bacterium]
MNNFSQLGHQCSPQALVALVVLAILSVTSVARAQQDFDWATYSQVGYMNNAGDVIAHTQSWSRPMKLDVAALVQVAGSDAAAADFQANVLPSIQKLLNTQLSESTVFKNQAAMMLDPSKLTLATSYEARVYFIGEGAGYRNTLGFNALPAGTTVSDSAITANAQLIFPDASSPYSSYDPLNASARLWNAPLIPGDFVELGTFEAGTTLDFFLIANGASGGTTTYTANATQNPDQINHVVAFALPDSPFLIVGFEDLLGGGDRDYNDLLFAVDIGAANLQRLVSTPEPATWLILAGCLGWVLVMARRHRGTGLDTD